jgi:sirohydrochlorin ferrochelatase
MNYTTSVDAGKPLGEIQCILTRHGARSIQVDYDQGEPEHVCFTLATPHGDRSFRLPANIDGIQERLVEAFGPKSVRATHDQALRVGWRILKDWVEAQVAIIEAGMVSTDEVMLPYMLTPGGTTVYEAYEENELRLLNG